MCAALAALALLAASSSLARGPPPRWSSRRQPGVDLGRAELVFSASQCPNDAQHDAQPCLQALIDKMHEMPIDPSLKRRHVNPSRFIFLPAGNYLINRPPGIYLLREPDIAMFCDSVAPDDMALGQASDAWQVRCNSWARERTDAKDAGGPATDRVGHQKQLGRRHQEGVCR